jgi:polyisoprenoid-binding protein YceI
MTTAFKTRFVPVMALMLAFPAALPAVETYTIDSAHSEATFRIRHLAFTKVSGKVPLQGTIRMDESDQRKSSVDVIIDAGGINTGNETRDKDLRSAKFFDVATYPNITFKSSAVTEVSKGKLSVTGTLTMHGQAKTVVIPVEFKGTAPGAKPGTTVAGFEGNLSLDRTDYGIKTYASDSGDVGMVGKEVTINLIIEADKVP